MMNQSQNLKNNLYFKKILKFCASTLRSSFEVQQKLESFEIPDSELKSEILDYFIKLKVVLPDDEYINYYLNNLSDVKGYTYNQLYMKLFKKVYSKQLLKNLLNGFMKQNEDVQIQRFIERNLRKISSKEPGRKRIHFLVQKGFKVDLITKFLPKYNL